MNNHIKQLESWHEFVKTRNGEILEEILADEVEFHSPFVWKPKIGKEITAFILMSVTEIFEEFRYIREMSDAENWALEFEARIGELSLRGIDLMRLNSEGKIIHFEVMIRPANALQKIGEEMSKRVAERTRE